MPAARRKPKGLLFEQLDDWAQGRAHDDWLSQGMHFDSVATREDLKYFEELALERGIDVDNWDWSIGSYDDYVSFSGRVRANEWLAWTMQRIEQTSIGPFRREEARPVITGDLLILETLLLSEVYEANWSVDRKYGLNYDYAWHSDGDTVCEQGVLAGATVGHLDETLDHGKLQKMVEADIDDICRQAKKSLQADYEWQTSRECFEELCEGNEWRFTEEGRWL
jgi:hypothetical protein